MLELTRQAFDTIRTHGRESYPDECCGLLLGRVESDRRVAVEAWPVANEWTTDVALTHDEAKHSLRDRFYIAPAEYLKAQRSAARRNLDIVGCYHSHPDAHAWPSERDRIGAAGVGGGSDFSFVILSVIEGRPADVASALLSADGQQWLPEPVVIKEA